MNYSEFYLTFEGNYTNSLQSLSEDRRKVNLSNLAASVVSDSVRPHRRQPTRLLHPQDSLGKNTGVGCHFLLQNIHISIYIYIHTHTILMPDVDNVGILGMGFIKTLYNLHNFSACLKLF